MCACACVCVCVSLCGVPLRASTAPNFCLNATAMPAPIVRQRETQCARAAPSGQPNKSPLTSSSAHLAGAPAESLGALALAFVVTLATVLPPALMPVGDPELVLEKQEEMEEDAAEDENEQYASEDEGAMDAELARGSLRASSANGDFGAWSSFAVAAEKERAEPEEATRGEPFVSAVARRGAPAEDANWGLAPRASRAAAVTGTRRFCGSSSFPRFAPPAL
jgi:hypothetical protein